MIISSNTENKTSGVTSVGYLDSAAGCVSEKKVNKVQCYRELKFIFTTYKCKCFYSAESRDSVLFKDTWAGHVLATKGPLLVD